MAVNIIKLVDRDNNTTINAHKGDKVQISLIWNPSTGYFWQEGGTDAGVLEQIKHDGFNPVPGSSDLVTFIFRIEKSGSIILNMARPWSETTPPMKWFQVDVKVT